MLDKDLAILYGVSAIRLREQVKRNIKRFPADFMFQLNDVEVNLMVSQNAIPSRKHLGGFKPYVFTEQGVSMLSSVLRSERAIHMNIAIMRAFVEPHGRNPARRLFIHGLQSVAFWLQGKIKRNSFNS